MIRFLMTPGLISATPAARELASPQEVLSGSTIFALHQRAAASAIAPEQLVAQPTVYSGMASSDLRLHLEGEKEFVALCFSTAPDDATFQRTIAAAAMASSEMQSAVHGMSIDAAKGLGSMHKPLLLIYGEQDALVQPSASAARAKELYPRTAVELYARSVHSPFFEESTRFNRALSAFVDAASAH